MARRKSRIRLQKTGTGLLVLGSGLLLVPTLRAPGWVSVAVGSLILGLHFRPGHAKRRGRRRHCVAIWERPGRGPATPAEPLPTAWSPRVFELMEWRRFEAVCEALLIPAGLQARHQPPDGTGRARAAIWLHAPGADQPEAVMQCKHWRDRPIPVERIRAFIGVMAAHGVAHGSFVTSSSFTADALALGLSHGMELHDGAGLIRLIQARPAQEQAALLALALEGEFWKPSCPSCNVKLVERNVSPAQGRLWGCPNYPRCRFALPMTAMEADFLDGPRAQGASAA